MKSIARRLKSRTYRWSLHSPVRSLSDFRSMRNVGMKKKASSFYFAPGQLPEKPAFHTPEGITAEKDALERSVITSSSHLDGNRKEEDFENVFKNHGSSWDLEGKRVWCKYLDLENTHRRVHGPNKLLSRRKRFLYDVNYKETYKNRMSVISGNPKRQIDDETLNEVPMRLKTSHLPAIQGLLVMDLDDVMPEYSLQEASEYMVNSAIKSGEPLQGKITDVTVKGMTVSFGTIPIYVPDENLIPLVIRNYINLHNTEDMQKLKSEMYGSLIWLLISEQSKYQKLGAHCGERLSYDKVHPKIQLCLSSEEYEIYSKFLENENAQV